MIKLIASLLFIWRILAASISPLLSNFGDAFRVGQVSVSISSPATQYDISAPFSISFTSNSVSVALSMVDYNQNFDTSHTPPYLVVFKLLENTPSPTNGSHAIFRVQLGLPASTSVARVKYLGYSTSILSQNFNIIVNQYTPGTFQNFPGGSPYEALYSVNSPVLNTNTAYNYAVWMSGIEASKPLSTDYFNLVIHFLNGPYKIKVWNSCTNFISVVSVRVTLIFMHDIATTISGSTYKLPYALNFGSFQTFPYPLNSANSWFDTSKIICGNYDTIFSSNFYQYTLSHSGNKVTLQFTVTGSVWTHNFWTSCLIVGYKMCPATYPYYDSSTDLCHDSCTGQNTNDYLCSPANICPLNCVYCSSNTVCTNCSYGYYMRSDNLCYSSCLTGTYPSFSTKTCDSCSANCDSCSSSTVCLICSPSQYLRNDGICYSNCLSGFYAEAATHTCVACPINCGSCTSLMDCQTCLSPYYLRTDGLCYSTCLDGFYPEISNLTCVECSIGCQTCTSSASCNSSTGTCLLGEMVNGGCTLDEGCLEVNYQNLSDILGVCVKCDSEFLLNGGSCDCKDPSFANLNGHCYPQIEGCISMQIVLGEVKCQFCSLLNHFHLVSTSNFCQCKAHYVRDGSSCKEICGDGVAIEDECDDGNTENGDGCSSTCQIQLGYRCQPTCIFIQKQLQISLVRIERVERKNEVVFTFVLIPNPLTSYTFARSNHLFSIIFETPIQLNLVWAYSNGELTATAPFNTTIEDLNVMANFTFDQKFILNEPIFLNFTIHGNNSKLEYIEQYQKMMIYNKVLLGISFASLTLLLLGSFLHKMVGVQYLHTLQLIYYLHFTLKNYTPTIGALQSLSLVTFNDLYWQQESQNVEMNKQFQKIDFSSQYTQLTIVFLAGLALLTLLGIIIFELVRPADEEIKGEQLILKIRKRLYHGFTFPFTLGFFTPYILASFSLSMITSSFSFLPTEVTSLLCLLIAVVTSIILGIEFLRVPFRSLKKKNHQTKQVYIPLYSLYWILMTLLMWLWLRRNFSFSLISMSVMAFLMLLFIVFGRPYVGVIDTLGCISHILLQLLLLLIVNLRIYEIVPSSSEADLIFCLVIIIFCLYCFFLNVLRIFLACCSKEKKISVQIQHRDRDQNKVEERSKKKQFRPSFIVNNESINEILISGRQSFQNSKKEMDEELKKMIMQKKKDFREIKKRTKLFKIVQEKEENNIEQ